MAFHIPNILNINYAVVCTVFHCISSLARLPVFLAVDSQGGFQTRVKKNRIDSLAGF